MDREILSILACPICGGGLEDEGAFLRSSCGAVFPVIDGIPRIFPGAAERWGGTVSSGGEREAADRHEADHADTAESFGYEWLRYDDSGLDEEERATFRDEVRISQNEFKGRLVLDAGCGMGRYAACAAGEGGRVVALDLSDAVEAAAKRTASLDVTVIQGDLVNPPLKKASFDFVYSVGVLHHTPDTRRSFASVASLVKPGGDLAVWLYGRPGRWRDFLSLPFRDEGLAGRLKRASRPVRFLHFAMLHLREITSAMIRIITTRLPRPLLHKISHIGAFLGRFSIVNILVPVSIHPDPRVRLNDTFDWYSPRYQYHHTIQELVCWFEEEGFEIVSVLEHGYVPKPGARGKRKGERKDV